MRRRVAPVLEYGFHLLVPVATVRRHSRRLSVFNVARPCHGSVYEPDDRGTW
ncbi:MAG: hypothetical protein AAF645_22060 [Myxococcota bacterium]